MIDDLFPTVMFNNDGYGCLRLIRDLPADEKAVDSHFVAPFDGSDVRIMDWTVFSTAEHNYRTAVGNPVIAAGESRLGRDDRAAQADCVQRYNANDKDLLDCMRDASRRHGMAFFVSLRLNHSSVMDGPLPCPGRDFGKGKGARKDFTDDLFQHYLLALLEEIALRDPDGLTLDFERKAPFFPRSTSQTQRFEAADRFLHAARSLADRHSDRLGRPLWLAARVANDPAKGEPQGQRPLRWIAEGLLDMVIPATHNHEPDALDWQPRAFLDARAASPRQCRVLPQIWPSPGPYDNWTPQGRHAPDAVAQRARELIAMGADGVYLFNFRLPIQREFPEVEAYPRMIRGS